MNSQIRFVCANGDEELMEKSFRFRYDIFCLEKKFLDSRNYKNGLETDIYDNYSLCFIAMDEDDDVVGSVRLIYNSPEGYPLERHCEVHDCDTINLPKGDLAEISRLVVKSEYRQGYLCNNNCVGVTVKKNPVNKLIGQKFVLPYIQLGLYREIYFASKTLGLTHWYAAMERNLYESLKKISLVLKPIGPEVDYYGPVRPYLGDIADLEKSVFSNSFLAGFFGQQSFNEELESIPVFNCRADFNMPNLN